MVSGSGGPNHSLACGCLTAVTVLTLGLLLSVFLSIFFYLIPGHSLESDPIQHDLMPSLNCICKDPLSRQGRFPRFQVDMNFGDTV